MESDPNRIVFEYEDGTTAIWGDLTEEQIERIEGLIIQELGQPDTLWA